MRKLSYRKRVRVFSKMDRLPDGIRAWCFHIGRENIIGYIRNHERFRRSTLPKYNVNRNFDTYFLRAIKPHLENFMIPFGEDISNIVIQADTDMRDTINHWGMQYAHKGKAYELADVVAWCNQKDKKIDCQVVDLRDKIKQEMENSLLK